MTELELKFLFYLGFFLLMEKPRGKRNIWCKRWKDFLLKVKQCMRVCGDDVVHVSERDRSGGICISSTSMAMEKSIALFFCVTIG